MYAHPLIPPTRYGSSIKAIDDTAAKDIPGYIRTIELDDPSEIVQGWALVIAENFPAAMKAADAVEVDWAAGPTAAVTESDILAEGRKLTADPASGVLVVNDGDVEAARAVCGQNAHGDVHDEHRAALHAGTAKCTGGIR